MLSAIRIISLSDMRALVKMMALFTTTPAVPVPGGGRCCNYGWLTHITTAPSPASAVFASPATTTTTTSSSSTGWLMRLCSHLACCVRCSHGRVCCFDQILDEI